MQCFRVLRQNAGSLLGVNNLLWIYLLCLALWKELLQASGAQLGPKLDLSSLAKVTDGYTQGHILQAIQTVLNSHRLDQQTKRPLTAVEFIPPLARQDPVYKEEEEAFKVSVFRMLSGGTHVLN